MILGTFAPGAATGSEMYTREGEVGRYLVYGALELSVGEQQFKLIPGDAFHLSKRRAASVLESG